MRPLFLAVALILAPAFAQAQQSLGSPAEFSTTTVSFIAAIGALSLAPGVLIAFTCFPYFVIVFSILRQGLGLQQSPPNMLIISLSALLTYFVMEPVLSDAWQRATATLAQTEFSILNVFEAAFLPFESFMVERTNPEVAEAVLGFRPSPVTESSALSAKLASLVPSFMLSEISRAFEVGFLVLLPFLIVDLVAAAVLMSMGMMMVPPAIVSLPFKLAFFVLVDGWTLVSGSLVASYIF